jgi:hypothetical protein
LRITIAVCVLVAIIGAAPAHAHHSRAPYDTTVEVTLEGTVAKVLWENPHTYLTLELAGPDGRPVMQEVEVGPLSTLRPLGLTEGVLIPGEHVIVRANPNRLGAGHSVVGLDVTTGDGTIFPLHVFGRSRPAPITAKAGSLAGQWVPTPDGLGGMVQGVRNWPLTDVGAKGVADVPSQQASQAKCVPWPAPLLMALPMLRTIEVGDAAVSFRFDWMNAARIVHLDVTQHPAEVAPSLQGHSIGWWEGETLVVDTVGFAPHREGAGWSLPSGDSKHLVERFALNEDRLSLTYQFTVEDPLSLTQPVTYSMRWAHRPELKASGQECNAEIATRFLRQ